MKIKQCTNTKEWKIRALAKQNEAKILEKNWSYNNGLKIH